MEQHPVPQNITGFEFKLVGDMTLKQFGYLAAGFITAFIFYASDWYAIIKFPLAILFIVSGVTFAFVPVNERPLDIWVINFFRSIYRPTLYLWKKSGRKQAGVWNIPETTEEPLAPPVSLEQAAASAPTDTRLQEYLQTLPQTEPEEAAAEEAPQVALNPLPPPEEKPNEKRQMGIEDLIRIREDLLKEFSGDQNAKVPSEEPSPEEKIPPLEEQVQARVQEAPKETAPKATITIDEMVKIREQAKLPQSTIKEATEIKAANLTFPKRYSPYAKPAQPKTEKKPPKPAYAGIFQITTPNLISGVVKDAQDQILPGVIVIIKNIQGTSVRALRTNKVGQFLASTPLESGTYYLEMDKEGYHFDILEIKLDGNVVTPLEIEAKESAEADGSQTEGLQEKQSAAA